MPRKPLNLPREDRNAWRNQLARDLYARRITDPSYAQKRRDERKDFYHNNKPKIREKTTRKHNTNYGDPAYWAKLRLSSLQARAKKLGLEFTLTITDLVIPAICPVLGIILKIGVGKKQGGRSPNSPSVDRVDNTKGYTPSNIRIISLKANALKRDGTLEDFEKIVAYMKRELP